MNPILNALAQGHDEEDVLNHIIKLIPGMMPRVRHAKKSGYNSRNILEHLYSKMETEKGEDLPAAGVMQARRKEKEDKISEELLKEGLKMGTLAFGAAMASRAIPGLASRMPGLKKLIGAEGVAGEKVLEKAGPAVLKEAVEAPLVNPLEEFGLQNRAQNLLTAGNEEENIPGILLRIMDPKKKKRYVSEVQKGSMMPLSESIRQFAETIKENPNQSIIEKGSEVLLNSGKTGNVKSVSGENLLVEKNGKKTQIKTDEIIDNPIGDKELAALYEDLIRGIEKHTGKDVSRNVSLAGYDADANELAYTPHGGATYIYDDIPQDMVEELLSFLTRKTTGSNFIGAWEEGTESPIGAGMSKLIRRLQDERKKDGKKEYSRKFDQIYDAFAPAREAKKRVMKAKRDEEKRRKKTKK